MDFKLRGLEMHSSRMWRWQSISRAFEVMEKTNLNALIFHQNDLIDQLVIPRAYFSEELMLQRWPVRLHTIDNNKQYIRKVIREAKLRGIRFFLEVKEIWYHEGILEFFPQLRKPDGALCPTDPFWWDFLSGKTQELLEDVPDIAGIIVSPATRESKISISTNRCSCDRCQKTSPLDWYTNLLGAMYDPLESKGKVLAVRDFSYTAEQQSLAINAASKVSGDIVIALKNTPHDYYPTFPNNPRIGDTCGLEQWVEFDTWGQFYGLGFFPCSVVEDMQRRLSHCRKNRVTGVWLRTDWEVITEASVFNSFNLLNLFGGGILSAKVDEELDSVYRAWLDYGLLSPMKSESCQERPIPVTSSAVKPLIEFMRASWSVMEKSVYVRGHLFHEDGMFPSSLERAFEMMTVIHGRDEWEPGASKLVEPTEENLKIIFDEKEKALQEVKKLVSILNLETLKLPEQLAGELRIILDLYELYVRGFACCARSCFLAKRALNTRNASDIEKTRESLKILSGYRDEVTQHLENTSYPHYVYWLLDVERLDLLIEDIGERIDAA